jgi:hypothetical protein
MVFDPCNQVSLKVDAYLGPYEAVCTATYIDCVKNNQCMYHFLHNQCYIDT